MRKLDFSIPEDADGKRAADWLRREQGFSYGAVVKLRHNPDCLLLDGAPIRTIDPLRNGSLLTVFIPDREAAEVPCPELDIPILYQDEDLIVFDKPAGVPCHPSKGHGTGTLANFYAAVCPGSRFRILGRLDKDTSGLVLAAKNACAAKTLTDHPPEKEYLAVLTGVPKEREGTIDLAIDDRDPENRRRFVSEEGRPSRTDYRILAEGGGYSLALVSPKTGRTHQIRVHFSAIGCPLAGDALYGGDRTLIQRHALHRSRIVFTHPLTGERMEFTSPLPEDMASLCRALFQKKKGDLPDGI
ncbi:MAG TPA: RluA family pseudouridine synthase [Oscillospiraceae bacterium]|nr:RluA family pseudouridine synthase [Oscillospiraceae bacterium]HRW56569.1 RluA family pseudouridine synthase [Oscillospiraceae bacterium]